MGISDDTCQDRNFPISSLKFWLDVEWDPKSAAHSCTGVNGMMTRGLGESSKALEEDPTHPEFPGLHPQ